MSRLALVALSLVAACDPASPQACEAAAEVPGVLEIGTGAEDFAPLQHGDEVEIAYGPQGGQHVYGSLRADGIVTALVSLSDEDDPRVTYEVHLDDGTLLGGYQDFPRRFQRDGESHLLVGDELVLDYREEGFDGLPITLVATVVDACGRELTAARDVTINAPSEEVW